MSTENSFEEHKDKALRQDAVSGSAYFTEAEIENFKKGSLPFPLIVYEGDNTQNVIEVSEVISLSGMADNNGTPTIITMYKHIKGKESERLTYRLIH
jgi:hypothetical protein